MEEDEEEEDEEEDDESFDASEDVALLAIPTRSHPHIFPAAPLSRVAFGSDPRHSLPMMDLTSHLTSYLFHSGNVVELVRPFQTDIGDVLQRFATEVREAGHDVGQRQCVTMSVSWRDIVEFIQEKREAFKEQQRVEQKMEDRKQKRERIRRANQLEQREEAGEAASSPDASSSDSPADITSTPSTSTDPSLPTSVASSADSSASADDEELLPIHQLSLITGDEEIRFVSIDLFPYLHAFLTSILSQSSLPHLTLLMLDDVDLIPPSDLPLYLHQWFVAFEQCVLAGRIQWYGVASSHMGRPKGEDGWVNVNDLITTAKGIVDEPHFNAIRFPLNVFDCSALEELNCEGEEGTELSTVDFAKSKGLLCISEGLIDTVDERGEERRLLQGHIGDGKALAEEVKRSINACMYMEKQYQAKEGTGEAAEVVEGSRPVDRMELAWAHVMAAQMSTLNNSVRWERALHSVIRPRLRSALTALAAAYREEHPLAKWAMDYRQVTSLLFSAFTHSVNFTAAVESSDVADFLDSLCPALRPYSRMEQKSLVLALCCGVDVVSTSEVNILLDVLKVAWKEEVKDGKEGASASSQGEATSSPALLLSREEALSVMRKCRQKFVRS